MPKFVSILENSIVYIVKINMLLIYNCNNKNDRKKRTKEIPNCRVYLAYIIFFYTMLLNNFKKFNFFFIDTHRNTILFFWQ